MVFRKIFMLNLKTNRMKKDIKFYIGLNNQVAL